MKSGRYFLLATRWVCCTCACVTVLGLALALPAAASVLGGPVRYSGNGHDYYLLSASDWNSAEREARTLGGHLVTLNDAAEQAWVVATFGNYAGQPRHLWIGLYDANRHQDATDRVARMNEFIWISGETTAYRNWSPFEPNDAGGGEECAHIWAPTDPYAGNWNDVTPTASQLFGAGLHGVVEVTRMPPPRGDTVVNRTTAADVFPVAGSARKIEQIVGNFDRERGVPTVNLTDTRYRLWGTDLGIPFEHVGRTWLLFGDTLGAVGGDRDVLAWSADSNLNDGLALTFLSSGNATYAPLTVPGLSQSSFEVPSEGVSIAGRMVVYLTTDHSSVVPMGRSVGAASEDDGRTFRQLYTLSRKHFINVSVVKVRAERWPGAPLPQGEGLMMFGSGAYRESNVRLAFQAAAEFERKGALRFLTGLDACGRPFWSDAEEDAVSLFDQPCVGEFSVAYHPLLRRWIMLYNCGEPRGILVRSARYPWGPWSEAQVLFHPWDDQGYCHFLHTSWSFRNCDSVHDSGRENEWGGEYGPYVFEDAFGGSARRSTIYFTMSTWNPYTVVLMSAELEKPRLDWPALTVARVSQGWVVQWSCAELGFRLEGRGALRPQEPWTPITGPTEIMDGRNTVRLPLASRQQFLRLVGPD
jgi:hypothetical protein